ncbi:hypothetical protein N7475_001992 [Penicillium sp. IBT 31633x]|nr:hypothetical protein N7475_001992 [Penicillium sp. IBT 31633x]
MPKQPPNLNWPHVFDEEYVFKRLNIQLDPESRRAIRIIAQEIYELVATIALREGKNLANMFKSANCRTQIQIEWRTRLHRLPAPVRAQNSDDKMLAYVLYRYIQATAEERRRVMEGEDIPESDPPRPVMLRQRAAQLEAQTTASQAEEQGQEQGQGQQPAQQDYPQQRQQQQQPQYSQYPQHPQHPRKPQFIYGRPYVVPNGDIQIIRVEQPGVPIVIRVSDLLADRADPEDVCPNGDWINIANIKFDEFKRNLIAEGYFTEGESMWLNHRSLDTLNPLLIFTPQEGEIRLSSLNMASTILRTIREHWPKLRNPSPDPWG